MKYEITYKDVPRAVMRMLKKKDYINFDDNYKIVAWKYNRFNVKGIDYIVLGNGKNAKLKKNYQKRKLWDRSDELVPMCT